MTVDTTDSNVKTSRLDSHLFVPPCNHFPFITEGYRVNHSFWEATSSILSLHNETMNIWSHAIGFLCVLLIGWEYLFNNVCFNQDDKYGLFFIQVYIFCAVVCLFFSAIYHWYGCISESCYGTLLRLDLTGIAILVGGSYFPAVYYGIFQIINY